MPDYEGALERNIERVAKLTEDLADARRRLADLEKLFDADMVRSLKAFRNQNSPTKWRAETRTERGQ